MCLSVLFCPSPFSSEPLLVFLPGSICTTPDASLQRLNRLFSGGLPQSCRSSWFIGPASEHVITQISTVNHCLPTLATSILAVLSLWPWFTFNHLDCQEENHFPNCSKWRLPAFVTPASFAVEVRRLITFSLHYFISLSPLSPPPCLSVCTHRHACHRTHRKHRSQNNFLLPCGSWGIKLRLSGLMASD